MPPQFKIEDILADYFIDYKGELNVTDWLEAAGWQYGFTRLLGLTNIERTCRTVLGRLPQLALSKYPVPEGRELLKSWRKSATAEAFRHAKQQLEYHLTTARATCHTANVGIRNDILENECRKRKAKSLDDQSRKRNPPADDQPNNPGSQPYELRTPRGRSDSVSDSAPAYTPCRKQLQSLFEHLKDQPESPTDSDQLVFQDINISKRFRDFQFFAFKHNISEQVVTKENKHEILALNSILMFSEVDMPPFITTSRRSKKAINIESKKAFWRNLCSDRIALYQPLQTDIDVVVPASLIKATKESVRAIDKAYLKETKAVDEENQRCELELRWLFVCRAFAIGINQQERRAVRASLDNEDTSVHIWLHEILQEVFLGSNTLNMWANGQSASSKKHRDAYAACGKKPDFLVVKGKHEVIFGEFKPLVHSTNAQLAVADFVKLGRLLQGSINADVKGKRPYGLQVVRDCLEVYSMSLTTPHLYAMHHVASLRLPRKIEEFDQLPKLFKALWRIRLELGIENEQEPDAETSQPESLFTDTESDAESEDSADCSLPASFKRPCLPTPTKRMSVSPAVVPLLPRRIHVALPLPLRRIPAAFPSILITRRVGSAMPASAVAAARARVFARDFTSLDDLPMPVETYRFRGTSYRLWAIPHLETLVYPALDIRVWIPVGLAGASVSAQQLASADYQTQYDNLDAGRFWETLDADLELLSNSMKVLIYVPPSGSSCNIYDRVIDMTGFRCPLILAPTPALDEISGTLSRADINCMLSRLSIPDILHSQYKVVTSHHLDANNADVTIDLLMNLHISSGGFSWEDYGDLANVLPGQPSLQESHPECHPDKVQKTHFRSLAAGYHHWLHLQTREVFCTPEEDEWDGCLVDILLISNVEKGRRVLGAIVIQNRVG
ncbi:hypothetical protein HDU89_008586 [Geranomyces variabilis]|nr:hypothetical protein HDU89_008586 [Geranomyces variabilis]